MASKTVSAGGATRVLAVSRALPAYVDIRGKRVLTSIVRERSAQPLVLDESGFKHNRTAVHTEHLLGFSQHNYDHWSDRFGVPRGTWPLTFWGENIVFDLLDEETLQIGTLLRVGATAVLQVTSPRNPCFKLSWRLDQPDSVLADIQESGRTGCYLRVLHTGSIFDGDTVTVCPPEHPAPTVADVARLLSSRVTVSQARLQEALAAEGLGTQCTGMLRQRLTDLLDAGRTSAHRWHGWRAFTVEAAQDSGQAIRSFELRPNDGAPLAAYRAGQHVQVRLKDRSGRQFTRAWSLSRYDEQPQRYRISIKRSGRSAASDWMHDGMAPGDVVELRAPAGAFHIDRSSNHPTVLISAGIGITPLLSMLQAYALLGPDAPPLQWIHVTRDGLGHAHRDEIQALLQTMPNARRHLRFTAPGEGDRLGIDYDAQGRLTLEALREVIAVYRYPIFGREVELPGAVSEFYLCGPESFERDVREMLASLGVAAGGVRHESFGTPFSDNENDNDTVGAQAVPVRFARSALTATWLPGTSLLDVAEQAGIAADSDCRAGNCHRCVVDVLAGDVTYDRAPAVPPPPGSALLCCSRPAGAGLTLDL